jgi:hypothetical protein
MSCSFFHVAIKQRQLFIALAFVAVATAFLFSQAVYAYNLEGPRWANQPKSGCCATFYIYYYSMYYQDSVGWDNGRHAWNNTASVNVLDYTTSSCCTITANDVNDNSKNWDGLTQYGYSGGSFTYAHLFLNFFYTQNYSTGEIQSVAAHELGHMIGLAHSSGCVLMVGDTYTRWTVCGLNAPVTDDINGANHLY